MLELQSGSDFGGRYKVIRCIGSGGMGAVYLATDPRYRDFEVALKVLYPGIIKTPEARERFKTEIIASYKIPHRNIVRAYEYFDEENVQAYAMEFVDGGDLQVHMRDGDIGLDLAIDVLRQAAAGLEAIHRQGIMHRDLKPENILLTNHKTVKIGDFGVARLRESNSVVTQIGAMVGTPKYFAPEYIETGEMDHRGDVYALGVIGYELLSGVSPFRSDSRIGMIVERIKRPQEPLSVVAPHCPADVARVVEKAMALSVHERYQSAEQLREDLELVQEGKPPLYARDFVDSQVSEIEQDVVQSTVPIRDIGFREEISKNRAAVAKNEKEVRKKNILLAMLCSVIFIASVSVFVWFAFRAPVSFSQLGPGEYEGVVQDIDDSGTLYQITLWKGAAGGVAVDVNRHDCPVGKLDLDGRFTCNDYEYVLTVDSANNVSALGSIKATDTGKWGSWSVTKKIKIQHQ